MYRQFLNNRKKTTILSHYVSKRERDNIELYIIIGREIMDFQERQNVVEAQRTIMYEAFNYIGRHPECGFKEWKTHKYLKDKMMSFGYTGIVEAGNIPGFYVDIDTEKPGPSVCLIAEMDALLCVGHPDADSETGAAHVCGHHCQSASLLGVASAFRLTGFTDGLCGKIRFMFVPAEEISEFEYRESLRKNGTIQYFGGKLEFMRRGMFDDIDLCVFLHTGGRKNAFHLNAGMNGTIIKSITYIGKASHAGGSPHMGINALYAANLGMQAANSLRETFRDKDHIRFHPIITGRVGAVNAIPDCVTIESLVRGSTLHAIENVNHRINRALAGAAACIGAQVRVSDRTGYSPVNNDPNLYNLAKSVMIKLVGEENVTEGVWDCGCTDVGDLSCVFPMIHPFGSGSVGPGHSVDYRIADPDSALILSGKYMTEMTFALLKNEAEQAKYILKNKRVQFNSISEYLSFIDRFNKDLDVVEYYDDKVIIHI